MTGPQQSQGREELSQMIAGTAAIQREQAVEVCHQQEELWEQTERHLKRCPWAPPCAERWSSGAAAPARDDGGAARGDGGPRVRGTCMTWGRERDTG